MTPEQARDKLDLLHERRGVHERVASVFEHAVGIIMARHCYTREEAEDAGRAYFAVRPARARKHAEARA